MLPTWMSWPLHNSGSENRNISLVPEQFCQFMSFYSCPHCSCWNCTTWPCLVHFWWHKQDSKWAQDIYGNHYTSTFLHPSNIQAYASSHIPRDILCHCVKQCMASKNTFMIYSIYVVVFSDAAVRGCHITNKSVVILGSCGIHTCVLQFVFWFE